MADTRPQTGAPTISSIAAHRGFVDALVAGLVPRYREDNFGLARLTLILPSSRAARSVQEAFIRHSGEDESGGLLMPRMVTVGDLDLDETLGPLLDGMQAEGDAQIPPAADPMRRWMRLAQLIADHLGPKAPKGSALLRLAKEAGEAMDRLLVEEIDPAILLNPQAIDLPDDMAEHWRTSLDLFNSVHAGWADELEKRGEVDAAKRRNLLFRHAAKQWQANPPQTAIVAAGVTSAAPALAQLLRVIADLPKGEVILPDLDPHISDAAWEELGSAGSPDADPPIARGDGVTHPQYHLKLLLNRMGVARDEVKQWHRAGISKAPPERSKAISNLFLPPEASKSWVGLKAEERRLSGVRQMECATPEEEAQAIALLIRETVEQPEKRVALITPDRGLAGRVVGHLRRWNIQADDTAGLPLSQTSAGRMFLLLAECAALKAGPVCLMALLGHPLVRSSENEERASWLENLRGLELTLRGPRPAPGLEAIAPYAKKANCAEWWADVEQALSPLMALPLGFAEQLDTLISVGEALCGDALWSREDGRGLSRLVAELRLHAGDTGLEIEADDAFSALRDAMDGVAVRPPYGGHPRVSIYGLLEARMTRADLVICGGLNEGSWPASPSPDSLLAPAVLRVLGIPGADFRIGLAAHDLAGALGAPQVVLSRAERDASGPAIASRFLLRARALWDENQLAAHTDTASVELARALDRPDAREHYSRPKVMPSAEQRKVDISVTALDRLHSDPYQFYANSILRLKELDGLEAEPSAAWQGTAAHNILEHWHKSGAQAGEIAKSADRIFTDMNHYPLMRALWRPRLVAALEWVEGAISADPDRTPTVIEEWGEMEHRGVRIFGKADRIDILADGSLAIVDYKTGKPPSRSAVAAGYNMQLGTTGLMVAAGAFKDKIAGSTEKFEYWSLGKSEKSDTGFGYVESAAKLKQHRSGIELEDFLDKSEEFLDSALDTWILGDEPFVARLNPDARNYNTYDQLMRLDEWLGEEDGPKNTPIDGAAS